MGFPGWLSGRESTCQCRRHGLDPWVERSPGEGNDNSLQSLAWRIPWTEEPVGYSPWACKKLETTKGLKNNKGKKKTWHADEERVMVPTRDIM